MAIDINTLRTMLQVNNLTPESPEADIRAMLSVAGYTEEEVVAALTLMHNPTKKPGAASLSPINLSAPMSSYPGAAAATVSGATTTAHTHKILGIVLTVLVYGALLLYAPKVFTSLQFIIMGYAGNTTMYWMLAIWGGAAFLAVGILYGIAHIIARGLYRTQSYTLWVSLLVSVYTLLWLGFVVLGAPLLLSIANVPDWMSFAISLFAAMGITLAGAAFLLWTLLALFFGVSAWQRREQREGIAAPVITTVLALCALIYVSGVLVYPARLLQFSPLCYGIASSTERKSCLASRAEVQTQEHDAFDVLATSFALISYTQFMGERFVFVASVSRIDNPLGVGQVYVDGKQYSQHTEGNIAGNVAMLYDGSLAYVHGVRTADGVRQTLYVDGREVVSGEMITIMDGASAFAYVVREGDVMRVVQNGAVVAEGKDGVTAFSAAFVRDEVVPTERFQSTRDEENNTITHTHGEHMFIASKEGISYNGELLFPGMNLISPQLINGKFLLLTNAIVDGKVRTYMIAEKGLLSDEVIANLRALGN